MKILRKSFAPHAAIGAVALAALLLPSQANAVPTVFSAAGAANVATEFANFQAALGDPNNGNAPGPLPGGRRQINWDAGIVPFDMPRDFFNNPIFIPTRGAEFTTATNEFRVSNDGIDNEFDSFNTDHPNQFTTFSSPRLFSPLDTNVFDITFFVPASNTPAAVRGFGAVFTDVDQPGITTLEYFGTSNQSLGTFSVLPDPQGLSFLGVVFDLELITRVRVSLGNTTLASGIMDGSVNDVVVLDDFLYSEPQAIAEPGTLALFAAGLLGLGALRRRVGGAA
ncbi:MAG: PEP-CTERM sorting domain-containing protein [Kiloniellales bacterium]|nr:PEP-CTERM sorting domain-containing protein [Kiloniellales bacterium]